RRREPVRGCRRRAGAAARSLRREARRRGARRLAHLDTAVRIARAIGDRTHRRRGGRLGRAQRRRAARGLRLHRLARRARHGTPAGRRLHDVLGPRLVLGARRARAGRPACALRRRTRALQERRRARGRLAGRRGAPAGSTAAPGRDGDADPGRRGARPRGRPLGAAPGAGGPRRGARLVARAPAPLRVGRPAARRDRVVRARPRRRRRARGRHPRHRRARAQRAARAAGRPVRACRRDRACALRARAGGAPRRRGARVGRPLALDARRLRRPCARRRAERSVTKPRLLFVARTRYALPLSPSLERKFGALRDRFELRVLATAADGRAHDDGTFRLVGRLPLLDGPLFYLLLPARVRRIAREHRPVAIVTQSPYEAAFVWLARTEARIVVELHGDWRTATRLYGSPLRRALSPVADAVGTFGLRRAAAVRT